MTVRRARRGAWTRRAFLTGAVLGLCAGCTSDGHFSVLGYSTKPLYDEDIRTVYVPIFQNRVFQTGPYRGLEFQLTRALIREIEANTPFKVVSDPCRADTELLGTVLTLTKGTVLRNQVNEIREMELVLVAEVVWRDLRTGRVLSNRRPAAAPEFAPPFDPNVPVPPEAVERAVPVRVVGIGRGIPELGESSTTALQMAIDHLAVQVRQMMEKPW